VHILAIRAHVEGIEIVQDSLAHLGQIAERTSLRHAVQLLTPCSMVAATNGRQGVSVADLEEVAGLFHDAKFSARLLTANADKYIS